MQYPLPRTVDEPIQLLFWRLDEALLPILGLFLGSMFGYMLPLFISGVIVSFIYMKVRIGRPEMFPVHMAYWNGFYINRGHTFRDPFEREVEG
jgi:conjugal transfer pilus assembly protein TraL